MHVFWTLHHWILETFSKLSKNNVIRQLSLKRLRTFRNMYFWLSNNYVQEKAGKFQRGFNRIYDGSSPFAKMATDYTIRQRLCMDFDQKGFSKIYSVFSIADYISLSVWTVNTMYIWRAWVHVLGFIFLLLFLNSRSLIQFKAIAKRYRQVAMTKMVFPTDQSCCKISVLEIKPAVGTAVAHAAAE